MGDGVWVSGLFNFDSGVEGRVDFFQGRDETFGRPLSIGFNSSGNAFIGTGEGNANATGATFAANTTHLLVGHFFTQGSTDMLELFVNPDIGGPTPAATLALNDPDDGFVANNASFPVDQVSLYSETGGNVNPNFIFDELRLGMSFADVTPVAQVQEPDAPVVPEPATVGLVALAGVGLLVRRR